MKDSEGSRAGSWDREDAGEVAAVGWPGILSEATVGPVSMCEGSDHEVAWLVLGPGGLL